MKRNLRSVLKDTLIDTVRLFRDAEIPSAASSLAYTTILSVIPLIALSLSVFKAYGGMDKLYGSVAPFIFENLAEGSDQRTLAMIESFVAKIHPKSLGFTGVIGLVFTSMSMLASVEKSINKIWASQTRRGLVRRMSIYGSFIALGPIALAAAVGIATAMDIPFSKFLPSGAPFVLILFGLFYIVYKYVPHQKVSSKAAVISASLTALTWIIAKSGYTLYVRKVVSYHKIYGGLGAIPILLVWIYVAWLVVLTGAAFSASLQKRFLGEEEGVPLEPVHS